MHAQIIRCLSVSNTDRLLYAFSFEVIRAYGFLDKGFKVFSYSGVRELKDGKDGFYCHELVFEAKKRDAEDECVPLSRIVKTFPRMFGIAA